MRVLGLGMCGEAPTFRHAFRVKVRVPERHPIFLICCLSASAVQKQMWSKVIFLVGLILCLFGSVVLSDIVTLFYSGIILVQIWEVRRKK